jgi:von Willebrand factor type A domain
LNLSVNELPTFHLQFQDRNQYELWHRGLLDLHAPPPPLRPLPEYEQDTSGTDEEEYSRHPMPPRRAPSVSSSYGGPKSATTAPTEYSSQKALSARYISASLHVPLDMVVVIPVSSSMQGLKITLLKDTLRFLVHNLGERDRMGLVTFGSSGGGVPLVGMTTKTWSGWNKVLNSIRPVGQKSLRADVVEGANVAMDLLMQRKAANPISTILLISDSSTSDTDSVDFVVQRAEAAK